MIGKAELVESLRTKDREEAKRRCHAKDVEVDRIFEVARRGVELSQPEAEALARQWLDKALHEDTESRARGSYLGDSNLEVVEGTNDLARHELAEAREALADGDASKIERPLELFLKDQGMVVPQGSEAWRRLAHAFLRGNVQYWERANERLAGQWREDQPDGAPSSPTIPPVGGSGARPAIETQAKPPAGSQAAGEPLSEIYAKYRQERRPSAKTEADWNAAAMQLLMRLSSTTLPQAVPP